MTGCIYCSFEPTTSPDNCGCGCSGVNIDRILLDAKKDYKNGEINEIQLIEIADKWLEDDEDRNNFLSECGIEQN